MIEVPKNDPVEIVNTSKEDAKMIDFLFNEAMKLNAKKGYRTWEILDRSALQKDMDNKLQYKVITGKVILCIFSIQYRDPFIWRDRDQTPGIYLHRIVANPNFKGQRLFEKVLTWAKKHARENKISVIRMDTWAENKRIIEYYTSYGFEFLENYTTSNTPELPVQNRNLRVALLELKLQEL